MSELEDIECSIVELIDKKKNYKSNGERHEMICNLCAKYMKFVGKGIDVTVDQLYNIEYGGAQDVGN